MKIIKMFLVLVSLFIGISGGVAFAQTKLAADGADAAKQVAVASAPASCAAFIGAWVGRWEYGDYGDMRLQVLEVDANCVAKGAYGGNNGKAWPYDGVEIKADKMEWLCNKARAGTCVFEHHGDTLWARYHDTSGGRNNGVFKKVAPQ